MKSTWFKHSAVIACLLATAMGAAARTAKVVHDGRSEYRIVTPDEASTTVKHAATELQSYLRQITGMKLPVLPESKAGSNPAFLLGPCERSVKAGLVEQAGQLREDGVLIRTLDKDIALLGQNERGNLYSVYVLLEKYLRVRFLASDCTVVPKQRSLELPEIEYSYSPPFMYRETLYFDSFPKEIAARQRLNGPMTKCDASVGGKIAFFPYVHSFNALFPEKEFFKDHPEYYALQGGRRVAGPVHAQLCLTNPDVLRLAKERVLKWMDENPDVPIIDVSQNDGVGACECTSCTAVVKEEGSQQGPILRFVNAIADEAARKDPHRWIETLAYAYSIEPPALTKPRPNVIIRLCHAGCYFHGFEQCKHGSDFAGYLDRWTSQTKRIFVWHYGTNFLHYLAPNHNLDGLAKDIRYYADHGVNGVMVQGNYQGPCGELAELRTYLCAQLMWDPRRDPMQVREEFCRGYYAEASSAVLDFLRAMDHVSANKDIHAFGTWDPQSTVPPESLREALEILGKARSAARSQAVRNRLDRLMLPYWYMQLTWPEKYGLSNADAPSVLQHAREVLAANRITHVSEVDNSAEAWLAEMEARHGPKPKGLVFDLTDVRRAQTENCADWRTVTVRRAGRAVPAVFQHPAAGKNADATYDVTLPPAKKGTRLLLKFGTVITNKTKDGVRFSVLIDGGEVWGEIRRTFLAPEPAADKTGQESILPQQNPFAFHELDLTGYAGRKVQLTLRVNALEDSSFDWANWVEPRIFLGK